ncbi:lipoprotein LpqH [Mycobacterium sp. CVI_P3]|uniref:Lipoprotein LpqH n=1 Tax=Mycobacterium pinniadriaticum TaxID=2994102 RepID=A0ABT3SA16_9MYCO|nr:lipoprotein LpqH [Mycobacterium pinniadriaticum]MCX2929544.1 lipoprotein LpqH [Mycobacterium pinniadriaticum]MCX2935968.1 lipoprotein LpqH [Mycobacterium pinniadriaticum]
MKRILAVGVGVVGCSMLLMACSDNNSSTNPTSSATGPAPTSAAVASGGKTSVKVEGNDLQGLDLNTVTCVKQGNTINIASGAVGGQQGLGVVMTDGQPPKVQSLGMVVDGNALAVSDNMGMKTGSADVKVDGNTYTITGEAAGADMKNPMAGMISKKFEITVTCS